MASGAGGAVKLLFLMSRDFGELSNAVYFSTDQGFDSTFLVPADVYQVNRGAFPVPTRPYGDVGEVLAAVEGIRPDVVLLFSGYLYADNGIFAIEDVERLVQTLRERGCRIAIDDPFLGLLGEVSEASFNWEPAVNQRVAGNFARVYAILRPFPHLYLVHIREFATAESFAYANPGYLRARARQPFPPEVRQALGLDPARPRWLFVLAGTDYQWLKEDRDTDFDDLLTDQLHEALHQGRQPVLVAPPACVQAVARRSLTSTQMLGFTLSLPQEAQKGDWGPDILAKLSQLVARETGGLVLLPYCRHDWFLSLVVEAEYVFYWNLFSNSVALRVPNGLPVFFFDRGHMARYSTPLFERSLQCYYSGREPLYLSLTEPIEAGQLPLRAAEQEDVLRGLARNLLAGSEPAEVVRQILARPG